MRVGGELAQQVCMGLLLKWSHATALKLCMPCTPRICKELLCHQSKHHEQRMASQGVLCTAYALEQKVYETVRSCSHLHQGASCRRLRQVAGLQDCSYWQWSGGWASMHRCRVVQHAQRCADAPAVKEGSTARHRWSTQQHLPAAVANGVQGIFGWVGGERC